MGERNLWILKPASSSRGARDHGRGFAGRYRTINLLVVAQSYIPKPMCLGGHKFDLRLYVLVTSFNPLEAWLYDEEGLLRVATRTYGLGSLQVQFFRQLKVHINIKPQRVDCILTVMFPHARCL